MKSKYSVPKDVPAAACGRCVWHKLISQDGWGKCLVHRERRWYQCMVCSEYEIDPEVDIER